MKFAPLHAGIDYFERAQLLEALYSIDPWSVDRNGWIALIAAAKHGGLNEDDVERWADCKTHREFDSTWRSLHERDGGATAGTIYHYAQQAGWSAAPDEPIGWEDEISVEVAPWLSECAAQRTAQPAPPAPDWRKLGEDTLSLCQTVLENDKSLEPFFDGRDTSRESADKAIAALTYYTRGKAPGTVAEVIRETAAYADLGMGGDSLTVDVGRAAAVHSDRGKPDEEAQRRFKYTPPTPPATARMEPEPLELPQPKQGSLIPEGLFKPLTDFEEVEAEWLIDGWIPKGQITVLAADGGTGKTSLWIDTAAGVSRGGRTFLDGDGSIVGRMPAIVAILSTEDSVRQVLKGRLKAAGANESNIIAPDFSADTSNDFFSRFKFGSAEMEYFIRTYKPALCVFDPIQGFIPSDVNMGARNQMRACTAPLLALGEETGTTFLLVAHSNKRKEASGRDRISDSADLWDIARSVIMAGYTPDKGIRYLSHEKSNYGRLQDSFLFEIDSKGTLVNRGRTEMKDRDFVSLRRQPANSGNTSKLEDCKDAALEMLEENGGQMKSQEMDNKLVDSGFAVATIRRAKGSLQEEGKTRSKREGGKRGCWFIELTDRQEFEELSPDGEYPFTEPANCSPTV